MAERISFTNVNKAYRLHAFGKPVTALQDVTFTIKSGSCTALLGHNGAGKTTAIRILLGLLRVDSGQTFYDQKPISRSDRFHIGYMPEVNKLPRNLTVDEILKFHLRAHGKAGEDTVDLLERVGLGAHRKKRIGQLSKGLGRRIAWAQAIAHHPQTLILDEPYSGLDPVGREHMHGWIRHEVARGVTILLSSHDLATVDLICDNYVILNSGKVVAQGKFHEGSETAHTIEVSGISAEQLERWRQTTFPHSAGWDGIESQGFVQALRFASYQAASEWLRRFVDANILVTRFGEAKHQTRLLKFFEV
jgi:ABC-2 type transport system ATP-binding protein